MPDCGLWPWCGGENTKVRVQWRVVDRVGNSSGGRDSRSFAERLVPPAFNIQYTTTNNGKVITFYNHIMQSGENFPFSASD